MITQRNNPLPGATLESDRGTIKALKDIATYAPRKTEHSLEALLVHEANVAAAEDELQRARRAYEAARLKMAMVSWAMHDSVVGARVEVVAQFGSDAAEVQAIGMTRKSARKRPARRQRQPA